MIFKRKSFRLFDNSLSLSAEELKSVKKYLDRLVRLTDNISMEYRIVKREETTCKRGEYCLLIYSECKENYLLNVGCDWNNWTYGWRHKISVLVGTGWVSLTRTVIMGWVM